MKESCLKKHFKIALFYILKLKILELVITYYNDSILSPRLNLLWENNQLKLMHINLYILKDKLKLK